MSSFIKVPITKLNKNYNTTTVCNEKGFKYKVFANEKIILNGSIELFPETKICLSIEKGFFDKKGKCSTLIFSEQQQEHLIFTFS